MKKDSTTAQGTNSEMDAIDHLDNINVNVRYLKAFAKLFLSIGESTITPPPDTFGDIGEMLYRIAREIQSSSSEIAEEFRC